MACIATIQDETLEKLMALRRHLSEGAQQSAHREFVTDYDLETLIEQLDQETLWQGFLGRKHPRAPLKPATHPHCKYHHTPH
jgi:hypothetical protein